MMTPDQDLEGRQVELERESKNGEADMDRDGTSVDGVVPHTLDQRVLVRVDRQSEAMLG